MAARQQAVTGQRRFPVVLIGQMCRSNPRDAGLPFEKGPDFIELDAARHSIERHGERIAQEAPGSP